MEIVKMKTGIKLLIFFYCFMIFQHFLMRQKFLMNAGIEALLIGTLIYLVIGFIRRNQLSRWMGMVFHAVFQVMESIACYLFLKPEVMARLVKDIPGTPESTARVSLWLVFLLVTFINLSAIVYLWRSAEYFSADRGEVEESEA